MKITIEVPESEYDLPTFNDQHIAFLWHVAQHNPAGIEDENAGRVAELVGREIVRRWLKTIEPVLWNHQGKHAFWNILQQYGKWLPVNGDEHNRQWTPNDPKLEAGREA